MGYPVSIISGNATSWAPDPAAARVHRRTAAALPAMSPTVEFTWARAIRSDGMTSLFPSVVARYATACRTVGRDLDCPPGAGVHVVVGVISA
jgi:hypothetical protein